MILIGKLFTPTPSLEPEAARAYLDESPEGAYNLLDVRQPWEYEEEHLPGARLVPLPQLLEGLSGLDPEKPTLVYCAVGGRSRVAAQLLSGKGFKEVYNLSGGIKAFKGRKAAGPQELSLDLIRGDETPAEMLRLAYGMEMALQIFYREREGEAPDQEVAALFRKLAGVEELHQQRLLAALQPLTPGGLERAGLEASLKPDLLEGGFKVKDFLRQNAPFFQAVPQVVELAMMLETQALDLYLRFALRCAAAETKEVLYRIGEEEKAHLASLARLLTPPEEKRPQAR